MSELAEAVQSLHDNGTAQKVAEAAATPNQAVTKEKAQLPQVDYSHEAMIQLMLVNQGAPHEVLAKHFHKTSGWLASVLASDSFQQALDPVRHLIQDPTITATMEERFRSLTLRSLSVLHHKLDSSDCSDLVVLKAAEIGVKALGMGTAAALPQAVAPVTGVNDLAERLIAALEKQRKNVKQKPVDIEDAVVIPNAAD